MTDHEYAVLVRRMREVQKRFFAGDKSGQCVGLAKQLEREVDAETARRLPPPAGPTLFDRIDAYEGDTP